MVSPSLPLLSPGCSDPLFSYAVGRPNPLPPPPPRYCLFVSFPSPFPTLLPLPSLQSYTKKQAAEAASNSSAESSPKGSSKGSPKTEPKPAEEAS